MAIAVQALGSLTPAQPRGHGRAQPSPSSGVAQFSQGTRRRQHPYIGAAGQFLGQPKLLSSGQKECGKRSFRYLTPVASVPRLHALAPAEAPPQLLTEEHQDSAVHGLGSEAKEMNETSNSDEKFKWTSHWWAAHVVDHMDPARPHAVTILGRNLVLWRDREEEWRCFVDECPHRLVPLSEGRIDENGLLQCSYHGWAFAADGACKSIPQALPTGPEHAAVSSPRACARAVPCTVSKGVLFVWPDENGWAEAKATPPPFRSGADGPEWSFFTNVRDLGYGWEVLVENLVDASHLPFAHHGIARLKRELGAPLPLQVIENRGAKGFEGYSEKDVMPGSRLLRNEFLAPSLYVYDRQYSPEKRFLTSLFCTPTVPGRSRLILHNSFNFQIKPTGWASWLPERPAFLGHLLEQDVLCSDAFFLHVQEKLLQTREGDVRTQYFMPTSADRYVTAYRQWLYKYAGGRVEYPPHIDTQLPLKPEAREVVMDRLHGHTLLCKTCSTAYEQFQKAQLALAGSAVAFLGLAALTRGGLVERGLEVGAAFLALAFALKLRDFSEQAFVYKGWDHATRH